jgi:hypothetical protein
MRFGLMCAFALRHSTSSFQPATVSDSRYETVVGFGWALMPQRREADENYSEVLPMNRRVYCGKCRNGVDWETYNFWQGTAWCSQCQEVVFGTMSKVPFWVVATVLFLAIRLQIT